MRVALILIASLSILACGGGDNGDGGEDGGGGGEGSLTLRSGTYTEGEFRSEMRSLLGSIDSDIICASLAGLSGRQVADALKAVNDQQGVTPNQDPDPEDEARAGEILLEECDRINPR